MRLTIASSKIATFWLGLSLFDVAGVFAQERVVAPAQVATSAQVATAPGQPSPGGPVKMKKIIGPEGNEVSIPEGAPIPPGFKEAPKAEGSKDNKGAETKPADGPIKRTAEPPEAPDRKELDIRPDDEGTVQFQFRNQPWPDLLRWIADVSSMSLDWQELPQDYLNLATQRKHTIVEARDLFNRHLLARGFTMLEIDDVLQVVKTESINPALVPRVDPSQLDGLPPNRYVRSTFTLDTLIAEEVVEEFKSLMSTNGKLIALTNTNRLEAMDAAANLKEVHRIILDEQSEEARDGKAREFPLVHVRASDVKTQLESFLGIEKASTPSRMTPEQMQMMQQQQQMMMQQQQQQQQGGKAKPTAKATVNIYLVANTRQNSVIASAPPNKMAVIAAFIKRVDVPNDSGDLSMLNARMRVYRLTSLDPEFLVASLQKMDALEPMTKLEVDKENKAIIAHASIADQMVIQQVVERLDGSAREISVIQLRRRQASDVAGTIKALMFPEKKEEENNRNRYYYDPWGMSNSSKKKENNDQFRVGANVQDNQVIIWANAQEKKEVDKLLAKLGELPSEAANARPFRVIDANRSAETLEYLKRLQEQWSKVSPNPLVLPDASQFEAPNKPRTQPTDPKKAVDPETEKKAAELPSKSDITKVSPTPFGKFSTTLVEVVQEGPVNSDAPKTMAPPSNSLAKSDTTEGIPDKEPSPKAAASGPPVKISIDENGNLVLFSEDREALNRLEEWMLNNAPPEREYEVYQLKHQTASWIKIQLQDYFKDDTKGNDERDTVFRWIFDMNPPEKKTDPDLGKKRKLRFVDDNDTKTIIVIGADDRTRQVIKHLIELWDVPEPRDESRALFTKVVKVQYSQADSIVEAVKDAYRDFLSANDKAFQKKEDGGKEDSGKRSSSGFSISDGSSLSSSGKLSLGIDKVTNTIIVVAEKTLLELVSKMIKDLDEQAKPSGAVQVLKLEGGDGLEKALKAMMQTAKPVQPNQKEQQAEPQQPSQDNSSKSNGSRSNSSSRKR